MSSIFIVVNQTNHFYHQNFHAVSFMDIPLYLLTFIFFTTRTSHQPDCSMTAKHLTPMNILMQSTCFVLGNFWYFYHKKDYSFFRLCKMMWRLNFLVVMVMAITNHEFVRYYVCAMHTYWFLTVYAMLAFFARYNVVSHQIFSIRGFM